MAGVVEYPWIFVLSNLWQHVRHHRTKSHPRCHSGRVDVEVLSRPVHKRRNLVRANIAIVAVELCGAGHSEAIATKAAGDNLGAFIQQADPSSALNALSSR